MKVKREDDLLTITSDLDGLDIVSEISTTRNAELILTENGKLSQYSLNIKEIDLFIKHLEKTKEILIENSNK